MNVANLHTVPGVLPEILNYHAGLLITIARIDPDPLAHTKLCRRGGVGHVILPGFVTGIHEYQIYNIVAVIVVKTTELPAHLANGLVPLLESPVRIDVFLFERSCELFTFVRQLHERRIHPSLGIVVMPNINMRAGSPLFGHKAVARSACPVVVSDRFTHFSHHGTLPPPSVITGGQ